MSKVKINKSNTIAPYSGKRIQEATGLNLAELGNLARVMGPTTQAGLDYILKNPSMLHIDPSKLGDVNGVMSHGSMEPKYSYNPETKSWDKYGKVNLFKPRDTGMTSTAMHEFNHLGDWLATGKGKAANAEYSNFAEESVGYNLDRSNLHHPGTFEPKNPMPNPEVLNRSAAVEAYVNRNNEFHKAYKIQQAEQSLMQHFLKPK